jgi:hypothetical protein
MHHLAVAVACCCDVNTLNRLFEFGGVYFEYVLVQLLGNNVPARDATLLLGMLQLVRHDIHEFIVGELLDNNTVDRLVAWVSNEETANAALGLLCALVGIRFEIWHTALQIEPAMLARLCALTRDGPERASAFYLLRVLCEYNLIEIDMANEDELPAALRALPAALADAGAGRSSASVAVDSAEPTSWNNEPPRLSDPDGLAWSCLLFLDYIWAAEPGLLNGDLLSSIAASASAHPERRVTALAYSLLDGALKAVPGRLQEVDAALPGICRDLTRFSSGCSKACRVLEGILKMPGGHKLLANEQMVSAALAFIRSNVKERLGDSDVFAVVKLLCELLETDQAPVVRAMMIRSGAHELIALVGKVRAPQQGGDKAAKRLELVKQAMAHLARLITPPG